MSIRALLFPLTFTVCFLAACSDDRPINRPINTLENMGLKGKVKTLTQIIYEAKDDINKVISLFDNNGNLIEVSYFITRIDGNLIFRDKEIYKYDEKGREIECEWSGVQMLGKYDENKYGLRRLSKYDEKGNRIEAATYRLTDGKLLEKYINKYDEQGNKKEEAKYDAGGTLIESFTIKHDNEGREIERISGHSDKFRSKIKYDKRGNIIEKTNFGYPQKYKYDKYDKFGNWLIREHTYREKQYTEEKMGPITKRTPVKGKGIKHTVITEREIEYY
jgi:hypothetical protein